jgi:hypothetical protein
VARAIESELEGLSPSAEDVAVGSGACGSDILFAEAFRRRGVPLRMYLPFPELDFLSSSVAFAGESWVRRFESVARKSTVSIATDVLGPLPEGADPYERTNLWMLDEARRLAAERTTFLCVWNGEGGDGPGGTKHMIDSVRNAGGNVLWVDLRNL